MAAKAKARFDVDTLRGIAGATTYARGAEYQRDGRVEILSIDGKRVVARVAGTEVYRVELTGLGGDFGGTCTCPAFEDRGFCKHMVAVALAANAAGTEAGTEVAEAGGTLSRMRTYLTQRSPDQLVEMILGLAERDPALFRKLDVAAAAALADDTTLAARLRKSIDRATRMDDYVEYRAVRAWAAEIDDALDALAELLPGGRAPLALELAEHAVDRIAQAVQSIDDSDGHGGGLLQRCAEIHLAAASAVRPEPVGLARSLFARELAFHYDTFDGAAETYADLLGEAGLAEYRRLATEAWAKLPSRSGPGSKGVDLSSGDYYRLKDILDSFAERQNDVEARIALRAKDLSSPWSYQQLAAFCLEHGRESEALRYAEEGVWVFEDGRPDERLVAFTVGLLEKAGRSAEGVALLWRTFEKAPSLELYGRLKRLGGAAAAERALAWLRGRIGPGRSKWDHPADLLVRILAHDKAFDAAWALVREHGASTGVLEALARASEGKYPREACRVYAARVDALVGHGNNTAYAEAVALVARMAKLQGAADQAACVAGLRQRFQRKRNFIKLLG